MINDLVVPGSLCVCVDKTLALRLLVKRVPSAQNKGLNAKSHRTFRVSMVCVCVVEREGG